MSTNGHVDLDAHRLVAERAAGRSFRQIAARHGISHEWARRLSEDAAGLVHDTTMSPLLARRLEQLGREGEAVWSTFVIPTDEHRDALALANVERAKSAGRPRARRRRHARTSSASRSGSRSQRVAAVLKDARQFVARCGLDLFVARGTATTAR